jgi:hypothetical protein
MKYSDVMAAMFFIRRSTDLIWTAQKNIFYTSKGEVMGGIYTYFI